MEYSDSDSDSDYDGGDGGRTSTSIQRCLRTIGIDAATALSGCANLKEEFTTIKKAYFKKILTCHPDKGGDAAVFRDVNSSFELVRKLYEDSAVGSFAAAAESTQDRYDFDYGSKGSGGGGGGGGGGAGSASSPWKSWQYYYDAAEEEMPHYKVELARSGRSKCSGTKAGKQQCTEDGLIGKGEIRIGSLDPQAGSYARWIHLECWRVPSRIWQGLPQDDNTRTVAQCVAALSSMNEVNLTGFNDLSPHDQRKLAAHAMDRGHWARLQARRPRASDLTSSAGGGGSSSSGYAGSAGYGGGSAYAGDAAYAGGASMGSSIGYAGGGAAGYGGDAAGYGGGAAGYGGGASYGGGAAAASMAAPSTSLSLARHCQESSALVAEQAASRGFYVVPRPGVNGAQANFLKGKTVVMTGVFPEVGGGMGLNLGKDRLRKMCEDFGARVTSAISGKTDLLIVGKEPGASKVGKARDSAKCQLVTLADLTLSIQGEQRLETVADATEQIESFSAGYQTGRMRALGGEARRPLKPAAPPKKAPKKRAPAKKPTPKPKAKPTPKPKAKPKATPKPKPRAKKSAATKRSASGGKKGNAASSKPAAGAAAKKAPARKDRGRKKADETAPAF